MEDPLKRLLETEAQARQIIARAGMARQQVMDETLAALAEARLNFETQRAGLKAPFMREAQRRADQNVVELTHKYQERHRQLRELAAQHEAETITAAMDLLLDPGF